MGFVALGTYLWVGRSGCTGVGRLGINTDKNLNSVDTENKEADGEVR